MLLRQHGTHHQSAHIDCRHYRPGLIDESLRVVGLSREYKCPQTRTMYHWTHGQVQTLNFPYELLSCATPSSITAVLAPPSAPTTINQCLTACQELYSFALVKLGSGSTCTCARGVTVAPAGLGRCMSGNTAVFRNSGVVDPGPSGMKKKKRKLEEDRRLCPGTLSACLIAGHGDAHEVSHFTRIQRDRSHH